MSQNATLSTVRLKLRPFFVEHIPVVVRFSPYLIYIYIYKYNPNDEVWIMSTFFLEIIG